MALLDQLRGVLKSPEGFQALSGLVAVMFYGAKPIWRIATETKGFTALAQEVVNVLLALIAGGSTMLLYAPILAVGADQLESRTNHNWSNKIVGAAFITLAVMGAIGTDRVIDVTSSLSAKVLGLH